MPVTPPPTPEAPENLASNLAFLLGLIILSPVAALWNAYVTVTLYNWFLASIPGFPAFTMVHMIGIALIISLLRYSSSNTSQYEKKMPEIIQKFFKTAFIAPLVYLGFGWMYHFMFVR